MKVGVAMAADPGVILDKAREAFKEERYEAALEKYEYFFDHALDNDQASYYGVRLSYCLAEWSRLGEKYPKATERLESKREESLKLLYSTKSPESFHDFIAICEYLNCPQKSIEEFISIHESDRELSEQVVRFIWDTLVEQELWDICASYIQDPVEMYSLYLSKFDQAIQVCKSDESLGGEDFERQIKGWCIRDMSHLLLVLKQTENTDASQKIIDLARDDLSSRFYEDVYHEILQKSVSDFGN